jgi:hypothetical protein
MQFMTDKYDDQAVVHLSVLLPVIGEVAKKLFKNHLPGDFWENATKAMKGKSRGTSKHNKFAESVLRHLDQLMRKKPKFICSSFRSLHNVYIKQNNGRRQSQKLIKHCWCQIQ